MEYVYLPIDRVVLGSLRAARITMAVLSFSRRIAPGSGAQARYVQHERVGYDFSLPDTNTAEQLRIYYDRIMNAPS